MTNGYEIAMPRKAALKDGEEELIVAVIGSNWWTAYCVEPGAELTPAAVKATGVRLHEAAGRQVFPEFVRAYAPEVEPPAPEPQLWQACGAIGGGWWVTEGEWEPGQPESVQVKVPTLKEALAIARDHNRRMRRRGQPATPLSAHVVRWAMEHNNYKVAAAARELGIHRNTLHGWFQARFRELDEKRKVHKKPPLNVHSGRKQARKRSAI